jgi:hypothetical protein
MQFQVPQFIEVEDKIFGPFTFKQFVYMAGGLGLAYLVWRLLPSFIAAPIAIMVVGFSVALAFMQYNGRPFMIALETAFFYLVHSKLYLWNNKTKKRMAEAKKNPLMPQENLYVPRLNDSRLHELAWSLDIKERIAAGTGNERDRDAVRSEDMARGIRTPREALKALTQ